MKGTERKGKGRKGKGEGSKGKRRKSQKAKKKIRGPWWKGYPKRLSSEHIGCKKELLRVVQVGRNLKEGTEWDEVERGDPPREQSVSDDPRCRGRAGCREEGTGGGAARCSVGRHGS